MLQKATISFLSSLQKNNSKEWFEANRNKYDAAKADMIEFAASLLTAIGQFDNTVAHLQPKDCLFRINRDVRFSKNKAPYKTNMAMYISRGGKKAFDVAGYYVHIEPGKSFMGGGIWMPMAPELKKIRQEIDYSFHDFSGILANKSFQSTFGTLDKSDGTMLVRPPKGYEVDNQAIEFLKLKSFIASAPLSDALITDKKLVATIGKNFKVMYPFIQFLNSALEHE